MSDYGDFCREQRQARSRLRFHWHECPHCAVLFGTGTSVAPGRTCRRHPDWRAPGEVGDDERAAHMADEDAERVRINKVKQRAIKEASFNYPCPYCARRFQTPLGRGKHVQSKHDELHKKQGIKMGKRTSFPEMEGNQDV